MADVAGLAGVSHQTVSRVINGSPQVRPATRDRVLAAMRELDYRPNLAARALVTGRSRTVGVVSFDTTLYGPASTLFGIERAAHEARYFITVVSLAALDRSSVLNAVERLRAQGVEGILVIAPQEWAARALADLPQDVPLVAVEGGHPDAAPLVAIDQFAGATAATEHLLELGHRTVWHIAGPPDWIEAQQRADGWRATLEAAGAPVMPVYSGDWSPRSGYEIGRRLAGDTDVDGDLRGQRPDGPRRPPRAPRGRPQRARPAQPRRVRRHPRGPVLHAAAHHRPPGLHRDGPQQPEDAARARGIGRAPARGAPDRRARADHPEQYRATRGTP